MLGKRKKTKGKKSQDLTETDQNMQEEIKKAEAQLQGILSPGESYIMMLQSILVWENPKYTAVMLLVVNVLFWLATRTRIYHLIGLTGLTVVFLDMWTTKIWPEIRVPPPADEDKEGWTPVHPHLMSVPELSHYFAGWFVRVSRTASWVVTLRQKSHLKFFLLMTFTLLCLAVLGTHISGIMLLYSTVMGLLLLPAVFYHDIPSRVYSHIEPVIHRVEAAFMVKRGKKGKHRGRAEAKVAPPDESDSDQEIREFCPSPDQALTCHLEAATDADFEDESPGHTPGLLTPDRLSLGPSREHSDNESVGGDDASFTPRLSSMPAVDDSQTWDNDSQSEEPNNGDQVSSLLVPEIDFNASASENEFDLTLREDGGDMGVQKEETEAEGMKFVPTHFKDSSDSDIDEEEKLSLGMAMPDIVDLDKHEQEVVAPPSGILGTVTQQVSAAMTSEAVSKTMTSLMASTMMGLTKISDTVRGGSKLETDGHTDGQTNIDPNTMSASADSADILSSFEFLEQEELEDSETEDSSQPVNTKVE